MSGGLGTAMISFIRLGFPYGPWWMTLQPNILVFGLSLAIAWAKSLRIYFYALSKSTEVCSSCVLPLYLLVGSPCPSGIPLQCSTDCGSETTKLFGLQNALRFVLPSLSMTVADQNTSHLAQYSTLDTMSRSSLLTSTSEVSATSPWSVPGFASAWTGVIMWSFSTNVVLMKVNMTLRIQNNSKLFPLLSYILHLIILQ